MMKAPEPLISSAMVGSAGEQYVLYRLLRRGILASLSPANAYLADILAFSPGMSVGSMLQVKTRARGRDGGWHMSSAHEHIVHERLFYVFVDMAGSDPTCFVVPSATVAHVLQAAHSAWLGMPGPRGPRRDTSVRRLLPSYPYPVDGIEPGWLESFRERWELVSSERVPIETITPMGGKRFTWTTMPTLVNPSRPLVYMWEVHGVDGNVDYRYIGRAIRGAARPTTHYRRNVNNLLSGRPYRAGNPDGFRDVHRRLAEAVQQHRRITLTLLCNVGPDEDIGALERHWQRYYGL